MESFLYEPLGTGWMSWTGITAVFFAFIALMLAGMTIAQLVHPTVERKGLLPIPTTRGDRLFIGLLGSAYIHLLWLLIVPGQALWIATLIAAIWLVSVMRWG